MGGDGAASPTPEAHDDSGAGGSGIAFVVDAEVGRRVGVVESGCCCLWMTGGCACHQTSSSSSSGIAFAVVAEVRWPGVLTRCAEMCWPGVGFVRAAAACLLRACSGANLRVHNINMPALLQVTGYLMMGALTPNCKKHSGE